MPKPSLMVVVTDTSGSMREHGKAMLARNLIGYVREQQRFSQKQQQHTEPRLVLWGPETSVVRLLPDQELPPFQVGGRCQAPPLLLVLEESLERSAVRILLISDGHLATSDISAFKAWKRQHPTVSIRAITVGPDATPATLAKIADPAGVFPAEEIVAAITSWSFPLGPPLPEQLVDVLGQSALDQGLSSAEPGRR
jgi:hypothetical protein